LPHAINFRTLCGANLVTFPAEFRGNKTRITHRVGRGETRAVEVFGRGGQAPDVVHLNTPPFTVNQRERERWSERVCVRERVCEREI